MLTSNFSPLTSHFVTSDQTMNKLSSGGASRADQTLALNMKLLAHHELACAPPSGSLGQR